MPLYPKEHQVTNAAADNILFCRQIHPEFFKSQTLQTRCFKGQKDPERLTPDGTPDTEYLALSVDIQTPFYNARQSFCRYWRNGRKTTGGVGFTFAEIMHLGLSLEYKPLPNNPHHWHIVFPRDKNTRKTHVKLLELASTRNWLYAPEDTLPINVPAKPKD